MLAFTENVCWAEILASIRLRGEGLLSCLMVLSFSLSLYPASLSVAV